MTLTDLIYWWEDEWPTAVALTAARQVLSKLALYLPYIETDLDVLGGIAITLFTPMGGTIWYHVDQQGAIWMTSTVGGCPDNEALSPNQLVWVAAQMTLNKKDPP